MGTTGILGAGAERELLADCTSRAPAWLPANAHGVPAARAGAARAQAVAPRGVGTLARERMDLLMTIFPPSLERETHQRKWERLIRLREKAT